MNKKYLIGLVLFSFLAFQGCEDLDTYPEGSIVTTEQKEEVATNNPAMAEASVNAVFAQFSMYLPNLDALGATRHNDFGYPTIMMATDMNGMDMVSDDNGYNWGGFDLNYTDRLSTSREAQMLWNNLYRMISASNNVIKAIPADAPEALSKYYLAQGLAVRAYSYFHLAQLYQFNYVGNQTKPCVPIITPENADDAALNGSKRATVEEVYDLILTDIKSAIDLLTAAEAEGVVRADKRYISLAVAYGISARVNLTMGNLADAGTAANKAIETSEATIAGLKDVNKPAFMDASEKNWMWGIIVAETDGIVSSGIINWISHMGSFNYGYANFSKGRQINIALYNSIPSTDIRKGWFLDKNKVSENLTFEQQATIDSYKYGPYTQVKFAPYQNVMKNATNANDMPLMRIEEMYLIKAEAENSPAALLELMKHRDPAYALPAGDLKEILFNQRRVELWGEGLIWYDIMRLNKGVDRRGGGYPNATMVFNIPAGDPILLWRLPEAEIQANPALTEADNNTVTDTPKPVTDL